MTSFFDEPDTPTTPPIPTGADTDTVETDRAAVLGYDAKFIAAWAWRLVGLAAAAWVLGKILGGLWTGLLPIIISILLCTVMWPPTHWMQTKGVPKALSVVITLLGFIIIFGGIIAAIAPTVVSQGKGIASSARGGVDKLISWVQGPPFNADTEQINRVVDEVTGWLQEQASNIASGVFSGLSVVSSVAVTIGVALVLSFFFLKDGPSFLPTLRNYMGQNVGWHLSELLTRTWNTIGGYIRAQATVSAIDAVIIGIGLLVLRVPMALALAVLTFLGGFIPIVGAVAAGAVAVLIALVTVNWKIAIAVLVLIILVQQLEGNILSPMLQSKAMDLHPVIVLLSVTVGSALFGIVGAFLAVPIAAAVAVWVRYHSDMVSLRTGEMTVEDIKLATADSTSSDAVHNLVNRFKVLGKGRTARREVDDEAVMKQRKARREAAADDDSSDE
ncbi:MAG: AI-2E family transporter [Corynebacterium sp.]|nr:AI-2E family transporter [Corynebacterium sp.]